MGWKSRNNRLRLVEGFLFGFEKSDRENITQREMGIYQSLASNLVAFSNDQIEIALKANELKEVRR